MIIFAAILNLLILTLTAGLYILYLGISVAVLKNSNISVSPNFYVVHFVILILQIFLTTLINQYFLKSKKQIIFVNLILVVFVIFLMIPSVLPAFLKLQSCRSEAVNSFYGPSGECMTFMENSKAFVVYIFGFFYLVFFAAINITVNILLLSKRKSLWIIIVGIILITFFIMVFLPNRALNSVKKQRIEIKQLPNYRLNEIPYRNLQQFQ